ncbi:hypothetical protein V6N13_007893 [Hibiscus sabdariffa]
MGSGPGLKAQYIRNGPPLSSDAGLPRGRHRPGPPGHQSKQPTTDLGDTCSPRAVVHGGKITGKGRNRWGKMGKHRKLTTTEIDGEKADNDGNQQVGNGAQLARR